MKKLILKIFIIIGVLIGAFFIVRNIFITKLQNNVSNSSLNSSSVDTTDMSEIETASFNYELIAYTDRILKGTEIKTLVAKVKEINKTDTEHQIEIDAPSEIINGNTYITIFSYDDNGYINEIEIREKKN